MAVWRYAGTLDDIWAGEMRAVNLGAVDVLLCNLDGTLVAYDWGEAFTVTNLVIKPRIDRLVNQEIAGTLATANGDPILTSIHFSLDEDARWHRAWTTALLRYLIDDTPANAEMVSGWIGKWSPLASRALEALAGTLAEAPVPLDANAVTARITSDVSRDTDSVLLN